RGIASVVGERHARDLPAVRPAPPFLPGFHVPEPCASVGTAGEREAPIGGQGDCANRSLVSLENAILLGTWLVIVGRQPDRQTPGQNQNDHAAQPTRTAKQPRSTRCEPRQRPPEQQQRPPNRPRQ